MSDDPYSRLYWRLADEFPEIYDSPDLAAYCRLLVAADQAWPSSSRWQGYASEDEVMRLEEAGLISTVGGRYRIRGMDKERQKRSSQASNAARSRWADAESNAHSIAPSNAQTMPSQAKPSQAETSQAEQGADALALWYDMKAGQVSEKALAFVRDLLDQFGDARLCAAMSSEYTATGGTVDRQFLSRVKSRLLVEGERRTRESEERRRAGEVEYQRRMAQEADGMPPEQRAANMARLHAMLKEKGVLS